MSRRTALGLAVSAFLLVVEAVTVDVRVSPAFSDLGVVTYFSPPSVRLQAGDTVNFLLNSTGSATSPGPWNQTITQSAFDPPCLPLPGGFTTGLVQLPENGQEAHSFQLPRDYSGSMLWFYTEEHCGNGANFAINPNEEPDARSFEAYRHLARLRNSTLRDNNRDPSIEVPLQSGGPREFRVLAWANDSVKFYFHDNVTATQSSLSDPCNPLVKEDGSLGWSSRKSGFVGTLYGVNLEHRLLLQVNDTDTIWGYVEGHCREGDVWAINPPGRKTLAAFVDLAKQAPSESSIFDKEPEPDTSSGQPVGYPWSSTIWLCIPLIYLMS